MPQPNSTRLLPIQFILLGIPGLEHLYLYLVVIFTVVYITSVLGNFTLLFIIRIDRSLHQPMYFFLCMLSSMDLVLSTSTTPKLLGILWLNSHEIYSEACLTQMFFIHSCAIMESALLLAMAFDRYVAICNPLRYTSILTKRLITHIGILAISRAVALIAPYPLLVKKLPFCSANVIHHCYCDHMAVVKLACANITFHNIYGLAVALLIGVFDIFFIICSYVLILKIVFRLSSSEARFKALGTCASHIVAILTFYIPVVLSSVVHRLGRIVPIHIHILLSNMYLMLPPLLNPIVYGAKTQQIRNRVKSIFIIPFLCPSNVRSDMIKPCSTQHS